VTMRPRIVVQQVAVRYSKATRGAPGAIHRNTLPRAFPLIAVQAPYVCQRHSLVEQGDSFTHRLMDERVAEEPPTSERDLALRGNRGLLLVDVHWSPFAGKPRRGNRNGVLALRVGERGRITTNGRHTSYSGQWYTRDTYNVAFVEEVSAGLFTDRPPDREVSFERDLF